MKKLFAQTTLYGLRDLKKIRRSGILGRNDKALGYQIPQFTKQALSYCSYVDENHTHTYGDREGVLFEASEPEIYALPCDAFHLMRNGSYLPGHERFIFSSVDEMLNAFPKQGDFERAFTEFFKTLNPQKMFSSLSESSAEMFFESDYCMNAEEWTVSYNEVTFPKPMKVKNVCIFHSNEELKHMLRGEQKPKKSFFFL